MSDTPIIEIEDNDTWGLLLYKGVSRVVAEFYAPWCRESQMMTEVISKVRNEFPDVIFCRYNMDDRQYEANEMKVVGIPSTLLIVPVPLSVDLGNSELTRPHIVEHIKGFIPADVLREKLKSFVSWRESDHTKQGPDQSGITTV
jgi:hypothetical protein